MDDGLGGSQISAFIGSSIDLVPTEKHLRKICDQKTLRTVSKWSLRVCILKKKKNKTKHGACSSFDSENTVKSVQKEHYLCYSLDIDLLQKSIHKLCLHHQIKYYIL
jgi:hypothetical protein